MIALYVMPFYNLQGIAMWKKSKSQNSILECLSVRRAWLSYRLSNFCVIHACSVWIFVQWACILSILRKNTQFSFLRPHQSSCSWINSSRERLGNLPGVNQHAHAGMRKGRLSPIYPDSFLGHHSHLPPPCSGISKPSFELLVPSQVSAAGPLWPGPSVLPVAAGQGSHGGAALPKKADLTLSSPSDAHSPTSPRH